jgi:hypothetical protein
LKFESGVGARERIWTVGWAIGLGSKVDLSARWAIGKADLMANNREQNYFHFPQLPPKFDFTA